MIGTSSTAASHGGYARCQWQVCRAQKQHISLPGLALHSGPHIWPATEERQTWRGAEKSVCCLASIFGIGKAHGLVLKIREAFVIWCFLRVRSFLAALL